MNKLDYISKEDMPLILVKKDDDKEIKINKDEYYDSSIYYLIDKNGNGIIPLAEENEEKGFNVSFFDGKNIIIKRFFDSESSSIFHYRYDDIKRTISLVKEFRQRNRTCRTPILEINNEDGIAILHEEKNWGNESVSSLYSLDKGQIISPEFSSLKLMESNSKIPIFLFTDDINLPNQKIGTTLTGVITGNGKMYDGVYDDYFNRQRNCELNTHPNFMQYTALKRAVLRELHDEVERKQELVQESARKKAKFIEAAKKI